MLQVVLLSADLLPGVTALLGLGHHDCNCDDDAEDYQDDSGDDELHLQEVLEQ